MKDSFAEEITRIEENLIKQDAANRGYSIGKLYQLLDNMCSSYLGVDGFGKNCITGDDDYLLPHLRRAFEKAVNIDIIVSFIMESGIRQIIDTLKSAADRGAGIRILTGSYLNITQPSALYLIKDVLGSKADLRLYNNPNKSFHPKCYICEYTSDGDIFIGSSNVSLSALTSGIEWNFRIDKNKNEKDFQYFRQIFQELFDNRSIPLDDEELERYSKSWRRPRIYDNVEKLEKVIEHTKVGTDNIVPMIRPRGA